MASLQNNESLMVAMLLFQTLIPHGIKNQNPWRLVGQSPVRPREKQKRILIQETFPTAWYGLEVVLKPCSQDPRAKPTLG